MLYIFLIILIIIAVWYYQYHKYDNFVTLYKTNSTNVNNVKLLSKNTFGENFMKGYIKKTHILDTGVRNPAVERQINNDYNLALTLFAENDRLLEQLNIPVHFALNELDTTGTLVHNYQKNKLDKMKKTTSTKQSISNVYLDEGAAVANDGQNVHDSQITSQMRELYNRVRGTRHENVRHDNIQTINGIIREKCKNPDLVLAGFTGGNISALGVNDREVLETIWNRSYNKDNIGPYPDNPDKTGTQVIQESIIDCLNDTIERGNTVCTTGRVARILDGLTLVDPISEGFKTRDMYKNEIFNMCARVLNEEIENAKGGEFDAIARSYQDPSIDVDDVEEEKFKGIVRQKINNIINTEYRGVDCIDKIRDEALLGI